MPADVIRAKCAPYLRGGKPIHRGERLHDSPFSIISQYQSEYRGVVNYYQYALNLGAFQRLRWVMEMSLAKTLAGKLKLSVARVFRRFKVTIQTEQGRQKVLMATVARDGKAPLVAVWGGISLARKETAALNDSPPPPRNGRTELVQRLLAETCERCGSTDGVQVHHIRALKDLRKKGQAPRPDWMEIMAARRRKTLVVCRLCHAAIHAGRPTRHANAE